MSFNGKASSADDKRQAEQKENQNEERIKNTEKIRKTISKEMTDWRFVRTDNHA